MGKPTGYFVGIGGQKCGTSWLGHYLYAHPQVLQHPVKEMHVFDSMHVPDLGSDNRQRIANRRRSLEAALSADVRALEDLGPGAQGPERDALLMRKAIIEYHLRANEDLDRIATAGRAEAIEGYVEYFRSRVGESGLRFGEVTPGYAVLPVEGFRDILAAFADARFVFVMRDPVDRLMSVIRDGLRKHPDDDPSARLERFSGRERVRARSAYERTLEALDRAAPSDQVLCLFYEDLFDPDDDATVRRITDFLDIDFVRPDRDLVVNPGVAWSMSTAQRVRAARDADTTYRAIEERFGRVPDRWREHMALI